MNKINLSQYRPKNSQSFSGRPQGEEVRLKLNLNDLDEKENEEVEIIIPSDTTSFNPSFFLGMLYDSIEKLGLENFRKKYHIIIETQSPLLRNALDKNIEDAIRNASNSLQNKSGLSIFG